METILGAESRQIVQHISETTQVAAARRSASDLAMRQGFGETGAGQVAILVTEAATNILKHAHAGQILMRPLRIGASNGIEIIALDSGPGMSNLHSSMEDGTSTAGSYGVGLGAMRRLSHELDIYSVPGGGTVVAMVIWAGEAPPYQPLDCGVVCLPLPSETICGDSWALRCSASGAALLVADGLGHGPLAAQASEAATAILASHPDRTPTMLLNDAHGALRATRGAAMAVAVIDTSTACLTFAGIGNIAAHVYDSGGGGRRQLVSHNGIVGNNMRKIQEFVTPWHDGGWLLLHSDGLATRWDLAEYPGVFQRHPRILAALLYRDFVRGRDDVTIVVLRDRRELH